jgi:hypothetical protein
MISVLITMLFLVHLMACMFYLLAKVNDFQPSCWVARAQLLDEEPFKLYLWGVNWALQTLTTVGYGDVTAYAIEERCMALIWMIFGVGFYSFTIGNLASMISSIDTKAAHLQTRLMTMSEFVRRSNLPQEIESDIKRFIENNHVEHLH